MNTKKLPSKLLGLLCLNLCLLTACGELSQVQYQVQSGDTLSSIARSLNTSEEQLRLANISLDTTNLKPGTVLQVPPPDDMPGTNIYFVKSGDTLASIAKDQHTTVAALMSANSLTNGNFIRVGQALVVPSPVVISPPTCTYFFQAGDTVAAIARRYSVSEKEVLDQNGLPTTAALKVGLGLNITMHLNSNGTAPSCPNQALPANASNSSSQARQPNVVLASAPAQVSGVYIVRAGDTLASIAARYNSTVAALAKINNLANPNLLRVGQQLKVPTTA